MVKELIHYNLFGTPAYLRRIASIKEKEEERRIVIEEKKVGSDYKRPSLTGAAGHDGVRNVAAIWKLAGQNSVDDSITVGTDFRRPSLTALTEKGRLSRVDSAAKLLGQTQVDQSNIGTDYKKTQADTNTHDGVRAVAARWQADNIMAENRNSKAERLSVS